MPGWLNAKKRRSLLKIDNYFRMFQKRRLNFLLNILTLFLFLVYQTAYSYKNQTTCS
ncbi:hypothetical protein PFLuk1_01041 [Pseudomonas fluorescens]|nr:hypothetical protein PFLuk1_01041 [Pseudomonas fluorescens]